MEHGEQSQCRVGTHLGLGAARECTMQREPGLGHPQRVLVWTELERARAGCAFCNVLCVHRLSAALTGCPGCSPSLSLMSTDTLNERAGDQPSICSVLLVWHYPWTRTELSTGQVRQVTMLGGVRRQILPGLPGSAVRSPLPGVSHSLTAPAISHCHHLLGSGPQRATLPAHILMCHTVTLVLPWSPLASFQSPTWHGQPLPLEISSDPIQITRSHSSAAMEGIKAVVVQRCCGTQAIYLP